MDYELIADLYKQMKRIRRFEEEAARMYTERKIGGFLHLYIGQEAIAVGAASVLEEKDSIVAAYRSHGHYLARGGSIGEGFAELLGKETGCSKGRGGSMHFYNKERSFLGGWGIVGAHVPLATGVAFAHKYLNQRNVTLCFLGDGSINIGPFHEGLSLAALWKLPVIYIIENNLYAMGTPLEKTSSSEDLSIRALGYPMARDTMNGADIFEVRSVLHTAIRRAKEENLPTLIEAKTYRYRGHSMADPGKYRTKEDVQRAMEKDPILQLEAKLQNLGKEDLVLRINQEVEDEIQKGLEFAEKSDFPDPKSVLDYVTV